VRFDYARYNSRSMIRGGDMATFAKDSQRYHWKGSAFLVTGKYSSVLLGHIFPYV
jgi:hypothetical protein